MGRAKSKVVKQVGTLIGAKGVVAAKPCLSVRRKRTHRGVTASVGSFVGEIKGAAPKHCPLLNPMLTLP